MHPDAAKRAANVRDRASIFKEQHLERTSLKLYRIAEYIETGTEAKWSDLIDDSMGTLREEYTKGDVDLIGQFDFIADILVKALTSLDQSFGDKLLEVKPLFDDMQNGVFVMSDLANLILRVPNRTDKEKFYVLCVIYAMDVEGVFDAAIQLLYLLYKSSLGQETNVSEAKRLSLCVIRKEMFDLSAGAIGYTVRGLGER